MSKHVAIYARVSTTDQRVASQMPDLTTWAERQGEPVKWYTDQFTGRSLDRPAMGELLTELRAGHISQIVVWRLDRLGRTTSGLTKLFDELADLKVSLVSLRDGFDLLTPAGRLHARILASVAEYETEVRAERIAAGLEVSRRQHDEVRRMAREGRTPETIAVVLGIKREIVRKILASNSSGVYWGGRAKGVLNRDSAKHSQVAGYIQKGLTPEETAKVLGIGVATVWRRVKDLGGLKAIRQSSSASGDPECTPCPPPVGTPESSAPGPDNAPRGESAEGLPLLETAQQ